MKRVTPDFHHSFIDKEIDGSNLQEVIENSVSRLAMAYIERALEKGKTITIPSLGIAFDKNGIVEESDE